MLEIYKTKNHRLEKSTIDETDIWISLTNPTIDELMFVHEKTGAIYDFLSAPLDPEESSRVEVEEEQILIIVNASIQEEDFEVTEFTTIPIGIVVMDNYVITITLDSLKCLRPLTAIGNRLVQTEKRTRFTLQVMYQMATTYLRDLKAIDRKTDEIEEALYEAMEDDLFIDLIRIEKTLVYFRNSLRGNKKVVNKIFRTNYLTRYEEDEDLLEDVVIELQQAMEMADINTSIIRSIRDGVASLMSNKLNETMKTLAGITIILTIPTMIFSFYGMNVSLGNTEWLYYGPMILVLTSIVTIIVYIFMKKRNLF